MTFREHDSLPQYLVNQLRQLRKALHANIDSEERYLSADREYFRKMKGFLSADHGECRLRDPSAAEIVRGALHYFEGTRYEVGEAAVLPNHVHVLVRPLDGFSLESILHSWKSFAAQKINELQKREGNLWQDEAYDRLVRDSDELRRTARYISNN